MQGCEWIESYPIDLSNWRPEEAALGVEDDPLVARRLRLLASPGPDRSRCGRRRSFRLEKAAATAIPSLEIAVAVALETAADEAFSMVVEGAASSLRVVTGQPSVVSIWIMDQSKRTAAKGIRRGNRYTHITASESAPCGGSMASVSCTCDADASAIGDRLDS